MIDEEETFKRFGYFSTDLKPKSNKKIIAVWDICDKIREVAKSQYHALCHHCAIRTEERSIKIGKRNKGKIISEERKEILRKKMKGEGNPMYGKHHTKESKQKIKDNIPDKSGKNNPNWHGGKIKLICPVCETIFERTPSEIKTGRGKHCSLSCSRKARKIQTHHTKPELIFEQICKKYDLQYKYTGDGSFWIGKNPSVNPDFVNCNGKKIAIEIFGDYWHSPLLNRNLDYNRTYKGRKEILKKYGWKLVIFWESDLIRNDAEQFILQQLERGV